MRKQPSEAEVLANHRAGPPFHSMLPTTFRNAVSACGIDVFLNDIVNSEMVMRTAQDLYSPSVFVFSSSTDRLAWLRISPASARNDDSKLSPASTAPVGF